MKMVTKQMHAFLDYPVAIALMTLPFVLSLEPIAVTLSVITGVAAFILTLLTDHHLGLFRIIPYRGHLVADGMVGLVFVAAPFVFSLQGSDALYFWINGGAVLAVVSLHKPEVSSSTNN